MSRTYYRIAFLDIKIELNHFNPLSLFNFIPFRVDEEQVTTLLFSLTNQPLSDINEMPDHCLRMKESMIYIYILKSSFSIKIHSECSGKDYLFKCDYQWKKVKTNLLFQNKEEYHILSQALMLFFTYCSSFHNTIRISGLSTKDQNGHIAFIHNNVDTKIEISNNGNEKDLNLCILSAGEFALRAMNEANILFNTPWSKKVDKESKTSYTLDSLFITEHSRNNEITKSSTITAFRRLLSKNPIIQKEKEAFSCIIRTLVRIVESIPIYILKYRGNRDIGLLISTDHNRTVTLQ